MKSKRKDSGRSHLHVLFDFWNSSNLVQRCLIVAIGVWSINAVVWILVVIKTLNKVLGGH
jgi:hypothetical protein